MTAQEAIKELKKHKETLNLWDCIPLEDLQSFDAAIEALEKQIPKKAKPSHNPMLVDGICPECNCKMDSVWKYCPRCGQKISW